MFGKSRCCSRSTHFKAMRPTGNQAFDAYKHDTLTRLANEQEEFLAFLERLRQAKDRAEFDDFLKERDSKAKADEKKMHNPTVAPTLGPHHFSLSSRTCVSPTHNHIPNFTKA